MTALLLMSCVEHGLLMIVSVQEKLPAIAWSDMASCSVDVM